MVTKNLTIWFMFWVLKRCFKKHKMCFLTGKNKQGIWRTLLEHMSDECDGKLGVYGCCSLFGT